MNEPGCRLKNIIHNPQDGQTLATFLNTLFQLDILTIDHLQIVADTFVNMSSLDLYEHAVGIKDLENWHSNDWWS